MNINTERIVYNGSGGFGDALMIMNKYKTLGLHEKEGVTLQWFTEQQVTADLVEGLFARNGIQQYETGEYLVHVKQNYNQLLREIQQQKNTFTTVWNGNIDNDPGLLATFESDYVSITPFMNITGDEFKCDEPFFILQMDAGTIYHNPRKHWDNITLTISFANQIVKRTGLRCVVVGLPKEIACPPDFISVENYSIIEAIKQAKFFIGLSGFCALCSLMSNKPTFYKKEDQRIHDLYYAVPEWNSIIRPINEILSDKQLIMQQIEDIVQ